MAGVGLFAKYVFSGLTRKRRVFERSVLVYVSIKNATLTPSERKRRVCVNQSDGLTNPAAANLLYLLPFLISCLFYLTHPVSPGCILPLLTSFIAAARIKRIAYASENPFVIKSRSWRRLP